MQCLLCSSIWALFCRQVPRQGGIRNVTPVRAIDPCWQAANYARLYALRAAMWHVDAVLPHVEAATPAALQARA